MDNEVGGMNVGGGSEWGRWLIRLMKEILVV